jgi:uroporphyrinogen-III synthase
VLVIVTRPRAQAGAWVRELQAQGQAAEALPLIDIAAAPDPAAVRAAWQALGRYRFVMFVSANAVEQFFALAPPLPAWPDAVLAGATGPGTSAALRAAGVPAGARVEPAAGAAVFDSEALWARLSLLDWSGQAALVVRGEDGRDWLAEALRERGATVDFVAAYRRLAPELDAQGRALLAAARNEPSRHLWHFSSSEAVARLLALAPAADWSASSALATHPRIEAAARSAGFGCVEPVAPGVEALLQRARLGPSIQSVAL